MKKVCHKKTVLKPYIATEQDEYEKCLVCGCKLGYKRNVQVEERLYYVVGCGQMCQACYYEVYKEE